MRRYMFIILAWILTSVVFGQIYPVAYQGYLLDEDGKPVDGLVSLDLAIYDDSTAGNLLWSESLAEVSVTEGLFTTIISLSSEVLDFNTLEQVYMAITVNGEDELAPRTRITAMPLSLRTATIHQAAGGIINGELAVTGQATLGPNNTNTGKDAFVAGTWNSAIAENATISGGKDNSASDFGATIGGGTNNSADGFYSTIAGGRDHSASGLYGTVAGGFKCYADGAYSFAVGNRAKAIHHGAMVMAANDCESCVDDIYSGGNEQFVLRADGGVYITNVGGETPYDTTRFINTSTGAYLTHSGDWTNASSRNLKENFRPIDGRKLLEKLARLDIAQWNYITDTDEVTHIGPIAQDFHKIFGLGADTAAISTVDPSGIALAAIQELYKTQQQLQNRTHEVAHLKDQLESITTRLEKLEKLLAAQSDQVIQ